jgi:TM2 domain-containing membrane protein YozV
MSDSALERRGQERQVGWAYLLWLPCLVGVCGLQRFYTGRWVSGLLWLLTGGLCMVGQIVDLFFIPRMVEDKNEGRPVW